MNAINFIQVVPNEILEGNIFALLDYQDLARVNQVSKLWKTCSDSQLADQRGLVLERREKGKRNDEWSYTFRRDLT